MADPVLTRAAARLLPIAEAAAARGLSANATLRGLSEAGQGVRRQDFLDAFRYAQDKARSADALKYVRPDYRPQLDRITEARHPKMMLRELSYTVRVTGSGPGFDADGHRYVNVSSSSSLTRTEVEDLAQELLETGEGERYQGVGIDGVTIVGAVRRRS